MGKRKNRYKAAPFKQDDQILYNMAKPNRRARRLGIVGIVQTEQPKQEAPERVTKADLLNKRVQQAKETQEKIVPPGMTYGEYMDYLKEKRQQLEEKKK